MSEELFQQLQERRELAAQERKNKLRELTGLTEEQRGHHISGFIDADGHFSVAIAESATLKVGYQVIPILAVHQAERDKEILYLIKKVLGCGKVRSLKDYHKDGYERQPAYEYRLQSYKEALKKVVPFFKKYPLLTEGKRKEFALWSSVLKMMERKEHLTHEGIIKIENFSKK